MNWVQLLRIALCAMMHVRPADSLPASGCEGDKCNIGLASSSSFSPSSLPVKPMQSSQEFLGQLGQVSSSNNIERKRGDASAALPFIGLTDSAEQSRSCCKNGGTCILGSFCACLPFFTGRSCEYDQRIRKCGVIPHGEWVQKGCSYCRCGYGVLHCFPNVFNKHCDDSEEVHWYHSSAVETVQISWFLHLTLSLSLLALFL